MNDETIDPFTMNDSDHVKNITRIESRVDSLEKNLTELSSIVKDGHAKTMSEIRALGEKLGNVGKISWPVVLSIIAVVFSMTLAMFTFHINFTRDLSVVSERITQQVDAQRSEHANLRYTTDLKLDLLKEYNNAELRRIDAVTKQRDAFEDKYLERLRQRLDNLENKLFTQNP